MRTIFSSILGGFLAAYEFSPEQAALSLPLVDATIECYGAIREAMLPRSRTLAVALTRTRTRT